MRAACEDVEVKVTVEELSNVRVAKTVCVEDAVVQTAELAALVIVVRPVKVRVLLPVAGNTLPGRPTATVTVVAAPTVRVSGVPDVPAEKPVTVLVPCSPVVLRVCIVCENTRLAKELATDEATCSPEKELE
jgi:hypothetical protein